MHWFYLVLAIGFEVGGTVSMKASAGFTNLLPSIAIFLFYGIAFVFLTLTLKAMEVGIVYAIWSGVGTALVAVIGIAFFGESASLAKAGFLLPKAGPWMDSVKHVFGVLLLGVAIYLLGSIPDVPVLYLWGALLIIVAVYLGATHGLPEGASGWRYLWKGIGVFCLVWGVLIGVSSVT